MSELNSTNAWPFTEIPAEEGLDINAIFGDSTDTANQGNPFEVQATAAAPGTGTCDAGNAGGRPLWKQPHRCQLLPRRRKLPLPHSRSQMQPQETPLPRLLSRKRRRIPRRGFWKSRLSSITRA